MQNILPTNSVICTSVPIRGVTQLGVRSYPTGSSAPQAITTTFFMLCFGYTSLHHCVVQINPSLLTYSGTGRACLSSPLESLSDLSRQSTRSLRTPLHRAGAPIWGIPRFRVFGPIQTACSISIVWNSRR